MTQPNPIRFVGRSTVLVAVLALLFGAASAQATVTRLVAVPLQGPAELGPWQIGLAAGLQRSLSAIDGVFVPPIGDAVALADRAADAGLEPAAAILERFDADALIGGRVVSAPNGLDVTLQRFGPEGVASSRTVTVPSVPSEAFPIVVAEAIDLLGLDPDEAGERAALAVAAGAPGQESLQAVALASSRLAAPDASALRSAAELDPESSWVLSERARAASLENDHETATSEARAATEAGPEDVEAWTILGVVSVRAGDAEAAEQAFRTALERNASHAVARAGLAGLESSDENALREYRRAIDAYPRLLEAHLAVAEIQGGPRGLQTLRAAGDALPDSARLHAAVMEAALEAGDASGAIAYLRATLEEPLAASPSVYALAADLPAERRDEALALLAEGAEAFPEHAGLARTEAALLRISGDPSAAEQRLRPFVEATPDDPRLANELALALIAQDRTDEARATLEAASASSETVRFNLAQALLEAGLPGEAAEELAPDMGDAQQDAEVWAVFGTALAGDGRLGEARDALDTALELDGDQSLAQRTLRRLDERDRIGDDRERSLPREAQAAFDRGLADLEQGRFGDAAIELRRAYEQTDDEPLLAFYLGTALQRDGRPNDAIDLYEVAVEAFPGSGTVLNNLGFAWLQLGRYDRALPTLRDAVEAAPDNARAHLNLGLTYYGLSRIEDALASWERAVELDPELDAAIAETRERAERRLPAETP